MALVNRTTGHDAAQPSVAVEHPRTRDRSFRFNDLRKLYLSVSAGFYLPNALILRPLQWAAQITLAR